VQLGQPRPSASRLEPVSLAVCCTACSALAGAFGDTTTLPFLISAILALVAAPFIITPALGSRPAAPATRPVLR